MIVGATTPPFEAKMTIGKWHAEREPSNYRPPIAGPRSVPLPVSPQQSDRRPRRSRTNPSAGRNRGRLLARRSLSGSARSIGGTFRWRPDAAHEHEATHDRSTTWSATTGSSPSSSPQPSMPASSGAHRQAESGVYASCENVPSVPIAVYARLESSRTIRWLLSPSSKRTRQYTPASSIGTI